MHITATESYDCTLQHTTLCTLLTAHYSLHTTHCTLLTAHLRVRSRHATLGDFRWDCKQLVVRLGPLLKKEHEDRLTYIQWELEDIVEELLKPQEQEEEEEQEQQELEFDLERVKQEAVKEQEQQEHEEEMEEGFCSHCGSAPGSYSCLRGHPVCANCRAIHPGCVCPKVRKYLLNSTHTTLPPLPVPEGAR